MISLSLSRILSLLTVAACFSAPFLRAQEKVDKEQVAEIAQKLVGLAAESLKDAPLKSEVDPTKGDALKHGDYGLMVLPDKGLTAATLENAGPEVAPVGQLWLKGLAPVVDGKVAPNAQLRLVSMTTQDETFRLPLCLLGVTKRDGRLELVVLGKDKTPLLHPALEKCDSEQTVPIAISGQKEEEGVGRVILNFGKYKATFLVMLQES